MTRRGCRAGQIFVGMRLFYPQLGRKRKRKPRKKCLARCGRLRWLEKLPRRTLAVGESPKVAAILWIAPITSSSHEHTNARYIEAGPGAMGGKSTIHHKDQCKSAAINQRVCPHFPLKSPLAMKGSGNGKVRDTLGASWTTSNLWLPAWRWREVIFVWKHMVGKRVSFPPRNRLWKWGKTPSSVHIWTENTLLISVLCKANINLHHWCIDRSLSALQVSMIILFRESTHTDTSKFVFNLTILSLYQGLPSPLGIWFQVRQFYLAMEQFCVCLRGVKAASGVKWCTELWFLWSFLRAWCLQIILFSKSTQRKYLDVKSSPPTCNRQAGNRKGMACWRKIE